MNACGSVDVLARLRERHPRFHFCAYAFVLNALELLILVQEKRRHVTGRELAESARELAIGCYGPLARTVLEHWGIRSTDDMGRIVFALVDVGVLVKREKDRQEEFAGLFDFEQAFDHDYPWDRMES